jgi:hypothetical protein
LSGLVRNMEGKSATERDHQVTWSGAVLHGNSLLDGGRHVMKKPVTWQGRSFSLAWMVPSLNIGAGLQCQRIKNIDY